MLILWLSVLMGGGMGMLIGATVVDVTMAIKITTVLYNASAVLASFLASRKDMPVWISWARWLSLIKYPYEAMMLADLSVVGHHFSPSDPSAYFSAPIDGSQVLQHYSIETDLWQDIVFLVGINVLTRLVAYLALRFLNKPRV